MDGLAVWLLLVFGAGTVTQIAESVPFRNITIFEFVWTADAADASIPQTSSEIDLDGWIFQAVAIPGEGDGVSPSAGYDVLVEDDDGVDLLTGQLVNCASGIPKMCTGEVYCDGKVNVNISGNSVNSASGTLKLFVATFR